MSNEMNISQYAETSYLEYALSVVKGRAIAYVQDGCKPVHRRIIYSMYKMGLTDTSSPTKCARVTGDVIGKYHPHGDVAVYEAMVLQSQNFRMRYPIIEGIGNFGSRDGDGWAAARYTECKFHPVARALFDELNEDAVNMVPNYDGKETEPQYMPARIPLILLNVTEGIGVGMATYMPSHNIKEVINAVIAYLENDQITVKELMDHIKGPDFPTGGQIISSREDMEKVYQEGRGAFRMRAKYHIENAGSKNWKIVFTEIPYGVSVKNVLDEIIDITNPENKVKKDEKGKDKKISLEQSRLKQLFLNLIQSYDDESDKENPLRFVITPRSYKQSPEELVSVLLGTTSLESNFSANFVLIGLDGRPCQKNLFEIISEWSTFRLETIERRCQYHLQKIANRLHILDGRKIVLNHITEVIKIIQSSTDPKTDLMQKYELSEIQVQDVLDLKLRQLGNLELAAIEKDYKELLNKKAELAKIIANDKSLKKQMIKELNADMEKFGDERLSEIIEAQKVDLSILQAKSAKVAEESITLALSEKNWVKVFKGKKNAEEMAFKEGDSLSYHFYCKNTDTLCMFDIEGKVYNYPLNELGKEGAPVDTLVQMNSKLSLACPIHKDFKYILVNNDGYGFIVKGENLSTKMKAGKEMFKVSSEQKILQPLYFGINEDITNYYFGVITTENKFLTYKLTEISEIAKGKGIVLCGLLNEHKIKEIKIIKNNQIAFDLKLKNGKESQYLLNEENMKNFIKGRSTKGGFLPLKDKLTEITFSKTEIVEEENKENS